METKTWLVSVRTYVRRLDSRFVDAGEVHWLRFPVDAPSEEAAAAKFRVQHPMLEIAKITIEV